MAVCNINMYSEALGTVQDVCVILPGPTISPAQCATLYLLHGLLDGPQSWLQRTRLVEYAEQYKLIIVMPFAQRSFYANQEHGYRWRDWVETELPAVMEKWFSLPTDNANRHIAGLSMGGYGALKLGLSSPEKFQSIGSFSGVAGLGSVDHTGAYDIVEHDLHLAFGGIKNVTASSDDLSTLVDANTCPYIYLTCGTDDNLLPGNKLFAQQLNQLSCPHGYVESPGGHEWSLWDLNIKNYLNILLQKGWIEAAE